MHAYAAVKQVVQEKARTRDREKGESQGKEKRRGKEAVHARLCVDCNEERERERDVHAVRASDATHTFAVRER